MKQYRQLIGNLGQADVFALLFLASIGLFLFRFHLAGVGLFIGNSDRLNTFLNIRKFEVDSLQQVGRVPGWDELMFMGFGASGLHHMLPGSDPIVHLEALFPVQSLFQIAGLVSCGLLILAAWSAYWFLREICGEAFPAVIGSTVYVCSAFSLLRLGQVDPAFLILILIPLGLLAIRKLNSRTLVASFTAQTLLLGLLLGFSFLQEALYAWILFATYAVYRSLQSRKWHSLILFAIASAISGLAALPRLITIYEDLKLVDRPASALNTATPLYELWRWFNNGIFGRYPEEVAAVGNRGFNLHEGLLLYSSTLAALLVTSGVVVYLALKVFIRVQKHPQTTIRVGLGLLAGCWILRSLKHASASPPQGFFHFLPGGLMSKSMLLGLVLLLLCVYPPVLIHFTVSLTHLHQTPPRRLMRWVSGGLAGYFLFARFLGRLMIWSEGSLRIVPPHEIPKSGIVGLLLLGICLYPERAIDLGKTLIRPVTKALPTRLFFKTHRSIRTGWSGLRSSLGLHLTARLASLSSVFTNPQTDLPFHLFFLALALGVTLLQPVRQIFNLLFLNAPLYHGRISGTALISVAVLVSLFCQALLPSRSGNNRSNRPVLLLAPLLAIGLMLLMQALTRTFPLAWLGLPEMLDSKTSPDYITRELLRIFWSALCFIGLVVGIGWCINKRPNLHRLLSVTLGLVILFQAVSYADFQLSGPQTWSFPVPFKDDNFLTAKSGILQPPDREITQALHRRLEVEQYRSVVVAHPKEFPAFSAPHLSHFWGLRLVDGYVPGVPARLAQLPWPEGEWPQGVRNLRAIAFPSETYLPWPLLSLLNVKYAIPVNQSFYFNLQPSGSPAGEPDVQPLTNPFPVLPRAFLVGSVVNASDSTEASRWLTQHLQQTGPEGFLQQSVVEGWAGSSQFSNSGAVNAVFQGDRITVTITPQAQPQFLVLDELYHPRWKAFVGQQELPIYPTNVVMRGVAIPANVGEIRLKFVPFLLTSTAKAMWGVAAFCLLGTLWLLYKIESRANRMNPLEASME